MVNLVSDSTPNVGVVSALECSKRSASVEGLFTIIDER